MHVELTLSYQNYSSWQLVYGSACSKLELRSCLQERHIFVFSQTSSALVAEAKAVSPRA